MRLAERHREVVEAHFTEGELDLEPPEELAIAELDDEAILEVELDNEDLLEQDVDEDTLEDSLEVLIHGDDDDDDDETEVHGGLSLAATLSPPLEIDGVDGAADAELNSDDGDLEESLDLVLLDRLALRGDGEEHDEEQDDEGAVLHAMLLEMRADSIGLVVVDRCRADEFVCRSCFLVRTRGQLADGAAMVCRDCSG